MKMSWLVFLLALGGIWPVRAAAQSDICYGCTDFGFCQGHPEKDVDWGFTECDDGWGSCELSGDTCGGVGPGGLALVDPAGSAKAQELSDGAAPHLMRPSKFERGCDGIIVARNYDTSEKQSIIVSTGRLRI